MGYTDRQSLRTEAYADPAKLRTRISIYRYQEPHHDLRQHVLRFLADVDGTILDLGCGAGDHTRCMREAGHTVVAADLSLGMATAAGGPAVVADAMALPFRAGSLSAVVALHMLYHVPDPAAALADVKRVLTEDGLVVISTNAHDDKTELRDLHSRAAARIGRQLADHGPVTRFPLDEADQIARALFASVARHDLRSTVNVPVSDPVVAFIDSTRDWYGDGPEVIPHVRDIVEETIAEQGAFRFQTHSGFLVCR